MEVQSGEVDAAGNDKPFLMEITELFEDIRVNHCPACSAASWLGSWPVISWLDLHFITLQALHIMAKFLSACGFAVAASWLPWGTGTGHRHRATLVLELISKLEATALHCRTARSMSHGCLAKSLEDSLSRKYVIREDIKGK